MFDTEIPASGLHAFSLREQAEVALFKEIVGGSYSLGERINELKVSQRLKISRGPLREALQRLGSVGVVRHVPNYGWYVPDFTAQQMRDLYDLREALTVQAARLAAIRRTDEDIDHLNRLLDSAVSAIGDGHSGYPQGRDSDLHEAILDVARNPMLKRRCMETEAQLSLVRHRSASLAARAEQAYEEHREIVRAISVGDSDEADSLMRDHIQKSAVSAQEALQRDRRLERQENDMSA